MSVVRAGESSLHCSLHPLAILNISEHLVRVSLQQGDPNVKVFGGLLGTQQGREIEIMNTFEIVINNESGNWTVDHAYFVTRKEQFRQVFPTFDFLGWYAIDSEPSKEDVDIHKQFFEYNETPLLLQMSRTSTGSKDLPVSVYESVVEIINNEPAVVFVKAAYDIETGEAERVAVDHASKTTTPGTGSQSTLIANLATQRNAVKMLSDRVSVIVQYLHAVMAGTAPKDEETLRQISALIGSLPSNDSLDFREEFMTEYNDVLLTTYLATLTKQLNTANELLDKQLFLASDRNNQGGGGGPRHGHGGGGRRVPKGDFA